MYEPVGTAKATTETRKNFGNADIANWFTNEKKTKATRIETTGTKEANNSGEVVVTNS